MCARGNAGQLVQYERQHLNVQRSSNGSHASATTSEQASNAEELLETAEATREDLALAQHEDQRHGKVNIAPTSAWSEGGSSEAHRASGLTPGYDDAKVDGAEDTLEDWNNNIDGESRRRNSVKMMVQQYEKSNESARNTESTSARTQEANEAGRIFSTEPPVHRGASMYDVETSDFESASVTSGSSAADGGWRSVRTSSAFSEGSRDVASIDRFDLVAAETQEATTSNGGQQQDEPGGHNTMITININYRCDTNPLRTSNGMTGAVADAAEKTVDIVVSAPAQAVDFKPCASGGRKLKPCSETLGMDDMRQLKKAQTEAGELMDLEEEQGKSVGGADEVEPHNIGKENRSSSSNQNKTDHHTKQRRSSQTTNRSCQTPEHEEYHDCDELHDSTLSFYEQASSQPVTPQDAEKKRRSAEQNCSSTSSSGDNNDVLEDAGDQPMIRIVQELTEDNGEVTSTITLNKAQIKEMQRMNGSVGKAEEDEKPEKRRKSRESGDTSGSKKRHDKSNLHRQQRIIDDNFCNEILDSTIHFDRLYGINRGQSAGVGKAAPLSQSPTRARLEECFSDSVVYDIASPGDESFDSSMSVGKLEGKPRYSGKTMGRLMMKRLKKLQQATTKGLVGPIGSGGQKLDTSDASTSSSQMLQTSGPKKPPRTFANSPKRTAPSCPMRKDLDDSEPSDNGIGWKVNAIKPKSHQVGWTVPAAEAANGKNLSIPAQVYSMLHYSEDESRKRLIKTGNSQPAPQQSSAAKHKPYKHAYKGARNGDPLGPKLDIDTVDGATTPPPRRHSSSTDFDRFVKESNVKSTPHRRGEQQQHSRAGGGGTSSAGTRRLLEQFLSEERQTNAAQRKLPAVPGAERRRRTTGGIFERRRQQQENFLDDARRSNHEPRRRKTREAVTQPQQPPGTTADECCPMAARRADSMVRNNNTGHSGASVGGKVAKRRTFRKAALLKRTRTLFEASKKKIWSIKKFETPKKMNTVSSNNTTPSVGTNRHDPNINRNSSAKKKQNLHHKHLGFTPDHLRCESCHSRQVHHRAVQKDEETDEEVLEELEEAIVPRTHRATQHAVPDRASFPGEDSKQSTSGRGRNVEMNRKSARSLNFASAPRPPSSSVQHVEEGERMSPRKSGMQLLNETKFLKTLRNLKISPKRMFRFASQSSTAGTEHCPMAERESHGQGEFQSFDDLNLDNVAHMGDFLSNIRRTVDGGETELPRHGRRTFEGSPFRQVEVHGKQQRSPVEENEEDEPIYQEISPKGNKTILNEFISKETNKRYLMVNNNPNILYATVSKTKGARERPGLLIRARSLTNVASAGATDPIVTSTPVSKQQNNTSKSQMKPSNRPAAIHLPSDDDNDDDGVGDRDKHRDRGDVESHSYLYSTAMAESSCHCPARRFPERVGSRPKPPSATKPSSGSSIRRSLFSDGASHPSTRERTDQSGLATDESDVSVLQDEDKTDSGSSGRAREQERDAKVVTEPPILRERVEDRFAAGVTVRREHERFQQRPAPAGVGNGRGRGRAYGQRINDSEAAEDEDFDQFSFEKDIIVEERKEIRRNDKNIGATNVQTGPGGSGRPILSVLKKTNNVVGAAPLGCFDTDSEIESLRRYEDKEIEELVVTLQENVTLSDMGSLETGTTTSSVAYDIDSIGYDTVDLAPPVARVYRCAPEKYDHRNVTVDTVDVSELISHPGEGDTFATSNVSPIKGSPSSGGKNSTSSGAGSTVMRNLKDKLRSSFRKSKSFIKSERQRFASYLLEERPGSKASTATTPSSSCSSSTSSSPQKRAGKLQQNNAPLAISDQDTGSGAYRSLEDGSSAIGSMGSMTELSNQYMSELILQIKRQADARKQLKQALAICRTTREFECSPELIEAERLLLLATLKETAARNELSRIDYASNGMTLAKRKRVGVVALNHFEFPLKETAVSDALFNYFYVVVCTYKDQVKGTVATERRSDGRVYFRDCEIRFHDLDADYEIRVEVFVLRLRKNMKNYSFESRYHLDKDAQKRPLGCPSPSKKLREAGRMLSFRSTSPKSFDFDNEFSRFKSQGFLTLTSFALLTSTGGELPESERTTFDATYATARTDCRSDHATTFLSVQEGGEPSASNPYYSVSSNFQQLIRRQGNENVFLVEDFKYLTLDSMAYTSNMAGTIGMSVNSEIRFEGSDVCGFLDVGEKGEGGDGISWNRRWCKMNGFALEFWNYPQECQEKQPIQCIDLIRCVNERIELAERSICSRPRTVKVDIFASKLVAAGISCNSSGIGSYKSTGATTSPNSVAEAQSMGSGTERLHAPSPTGGRGRNNVRCFLLATDTQADLKRWLNELNRVVKFLKEWKI
uniref:PH domain-containing protein n=1 Tax=Anopheles atroparvus TaxID=41427 RepID=A0A182J977_ANOAO